MCDLQFGNHYNQFRCERYLITVLINTVNYAKIQIKFICEESICRSFSNSRIHMLVDKGRSTFIARETKRNLAPIV